MATGYLNLTPGYIKLMKNLPQEVEMQILTSSPKANSFYKGGRFKKFIPGLYKLNGKLLQKQIPNLKVWEWLNGSWTFHAKGAWIYEEKQSCPSATIIGSSNFSQRSNRKDSEL